MGSILIVCSGLVWAKMPEPIFCPSPALKTPSVEHCDPDLLIPAACREYKIIMMKNQTKSGMYG